MVIIYLGLGLGILFVCFCHLYGFWKTISLVLPALKLYMESIIQYFFICHLLLTVMFVYIYNSFICIANYLPLYEMLQFCSCGCLRLFLVLGNF